MTHSPWPELLDTPHNSGTDSTEAQFWECDQPGRLPNYKRIARFVNDHHPTAPIRFYNITHGRLTTFFSPHQLHFLISAAHEGSTVLAG
jgi:hypothetical protein